MEEQIGPGAYFRWEGHDGTTGSDYYVVVAPGYSKKKGYHFFAGLRKIPADHGASGKEFSSMREALHYAYDMWHVPKPGTMPAGWTGYRQEDIVNKDIVTEGTQASSASSSKPTKTSKLTIQPEVDNSHIEQTGMSVQTMRSQFEDRVGQRVTPEQYCFAYAASPVMGFLPAMYSRSRFTGVDGQNFDPMGSNNTVNLMGDGSIPGTKDNRPDERPPLMATCQEPDEASFNEYFQQSLSNERLYDMPDKFGELPKDWWKDPEKYKSKGNLYPEFKSAYGSDDNPDVRNYKWGNMDVKMRIKIPAKAFNQGFIDEWNARFLNAYQASVASQAAEAAQIQGHPDASMLAEQAKQALNMKEILTDISGGKKSDNKGTNVGGTLSGSSYEVTLKAKDVALFDQFKESVENHILQLTGSNHHIRDHAVGRTGLNFLKIYRRSQEIEASGDEELKEMYGLQNGFDFEQVYHQKMMLRGSQMFVYGEDGMPIALAVDEGAGQQWRQEAKSKKIGTRYILKDPLAFIERFVPGFSKASEDETTKLDMLSQFHELASANKIPVTHQDVYDARTVAPLLTNPQINIPKLDQYKMPVDNENNSLNAEQISGMQDLNYESGNLVTPYSVEATQEKDANGRSVFATRYFDTKMNKYAYGPIPVDTQLDANGSQRFEGVPTTTPNSRMLLTSPDGSPYIVKRNEFQLYDTDSCGKFIPGEYYDISLGPKGVSSMGWHRDGVDIPDGFALTERTHKAEWNQDQGAYVSRQQSGDPFTKGLIESPDMDPNDYAIERGKGRNKQYTYTDNGPLMMYIKDKLKLPDGVMDPFTRMNMMDLKIISEITSEGKKFYKENQKRFSQYQDANDVPPDELDDYKQYVYGKTISDCKGEQVPQEIFKTLGESLKDPETAMQPKQGEIWALEAHPPEGSTEQPDWVKMQGQGIVFSSSEHMSKMDMGLPGVKALLDDGWIVTPKLYVREDGISYGMPSLNTSDNPSESFVYYAKDETGSSNYMTYMKNTFPVQEEIPEQDSPLPEDEELQLPENEWDKWEEELIQTPDFPTGLPTMPGQPVPQRVQPTVPQPVVPQSQSPNLQSPKALGPSLTQRPGRLPHGGPKPVGVRPIKPNKPKRDMNIFNDFEEDIYSSINIDKIVVMANKLDKQGRTQEADAVDQVIKKLSQRKKNANPSCS